MEKKENFQEFVEKKLNDFPFITLGQNMFSSTRYMSINLIGLRNYVLDHTKGETEITVFERKKLENIYNSQIVKKEKYLYIETLGKHLIQEFVEEFLQKNPNTPLKEIKLNEGVQALINIMENCNINAIPWTDYDRTPTIEIIEVQFEFTTQLILNLRFKQSITKLNYVQEKFYEKFEQIPWYNLVFEEFQRNIKNIATDIFLFDYDEINDNTEADVTNCNYCVIKHIASSDESETFIIQTTDL